MTDARILDLASGLTAITNEPMMVGMPTYVWKQMTMVLMSSVRNIAYMRQITVLATVQNSEIIPEEV
jgi:hypothetical protein